MPDAAALRDLVGRRTGWSPLVVEPERARLLRQALGLAGPPYAADGGSSRFDGALAPPTYLAVVRTIEPALDLPPLGPALNGGNHFRWLRPVFVEDQLRRRTELVAVESRDGRTGPLTLLTTETTVLRDDELVAQGRSTNIYR